jgi:hypothetical protein
VDHVIPERVTFQHHVLHHSIPGRAALFTPVSGQLTTIYSVRNNSISPLFIATRSGYVFNLVVSTTLSVQGLTDLCNAKTGRIFSIRGDTWAAIPTNSFLISWIQSFS